MNTQPEGLESKLSASSLAVLMNFPDCEARKQLVLGERGIKDRKMEKAAVQAGSRDIERLLDLPKVKSKAHPGLKVNLHPSYISTVGR